MNASYGTASLGERKFFRDNSINFARCGRCNVSAANIAQLLESFLACGETAGVTNAATWTGGTCCSEENDFHKIRYWCGVRFYFWGEQGWTRFSRRCFRGAFCVTAPPRSYRWFSSHLRTRRPRVFVRDAGRRRLYRTALRDCASR